MGFYFTNSPPDPERKRGPRIGSGGMSTTEKIARRDRIRKESGRMDYNELSRLLRQSWDDDEPAAAAQARAKLREYALQLIEPQRKRVRPRF